MSTQETILYLIAAVFHASGIALSFPALLHTRTPQGAFGWVMSLCIFPYLAIPLYLILGPRKFAGYIRTRRAKTSASTPLKGINNKILRTLEPFHNGARNTRPCLFTPLQKLVDLTPLSGNSCDVLIDGEQAFPALQEAVRQAKNYVLIQFYIIKNDRVGEQFKNLLIERAKAGISVYVSFDEIGSHKLTLGYISALRQAGVHVEPFNGKRFFLRNIIRMNFRNHRKVVIVDGHTCFIGGFNIGEEYLGKGEIGYWRDTIVKFKGPAVLQAQLAFIEDWNWSTEQDINGLSWETNAQEEDKTVMVLPTGPADEASTWQAAVIAQANSAQQRIWIATPYFSPDSAVLAALQAAALRGVDVRVIIPVKNDNRLVKLSAQTYLPETVPYGIKMLKYKKGFLHQKVILVDDEISSIGTANLDNRSLVLNFEITVFVNDIEIANKVENMLKKDLRSCEEMKADDYLSRNLGYRVVCNIARLMSPIL